ncbi:MULTISPECIES: right-handed parallel beta-helix repeat-containing protein [Streptomyces]|uniref:right-handed parallel beta-helix repeat-containing protein n=1 Tax=Streptomyces scabiei TaxID=1930 RepID=UPI001F20236E|nr:MULTISPECIES: right-handed parallel beta-helix repeat-containing protein [Streptomyces]MDX2537144.1 right-handed parallel beta-helix repeat-containing protein [Streptomyces scabiei]MDX2797504.1 right-handed parallel beta-helix repeat-containing protein [Streptomyces scabiei]MDX2832547.1 right-handed parallel beta-helix repeat-containing protein [Streptomyces scabiei]MDX2854702.1 right-handed parallel beta-helix repeat-containing protein [Streptomyces scabiei]MDX3026808.1 right-handed parall
MPPQSGGSPQSGEPTRPIGQPAGPGGAPAPERGSARQPAVWLAGGAFLLALAALVVAVTRDGGSSEPEVTAGATTAGPRESVISPPSDEPSVLPTRTAAPEPAPTEHATSGSVPEAAVTCPAASVKVSDATTLEQALAQARPGDSIALANGVYAGNFTAEVSGTAEKPIFLCGSAGAVVDGGDTDDGYAFHLDRVSNWRLVGFTVRNAQKGVMADGTVGTVIQGLTVEQIGDEAIHLRNFSSDNMVRDNTIRDTGLRREKYGEGVYIGTSKSNWCTVSDCKTDASDRNVVLGNDIRDTTAESIDIKEGTSDGKVIDNTFDGSKLSGSHNNDSWVDVKGNGWLLQGNTGSNSPEDGFQTHQLVNGWGTGNIFKDNTANVDGPGYGFHLTTDGNKVTCDNKAKDAGEGLANVDCAS